MKANERTLKKLDRQYLRQVIYPRLLRGKPEGVSITDKSVCWTWPDACANGRAIVSTPEGNLYVARTLYKLLAPKLGLPALTEGNLRNECKNPLCTNPQHYSMSKRAAKAAEFRAGADFDPEQLKAEPAPVKAEPKPAPKAEPKAAAKAEPKQSEPKKRKALPSGVERRKKAPAAARAFDPAWG